ncbi:type II secretion system F family protein [Paenibacillus kandeliae]|uniref:type II secretion system F family protein n=1 Tax=Paenibacillus kandeliae TaxID=3231269 RepID=UPI00345B27DC
MTVETWFLILLFLTVVVITFAVLEISAVRRKSKLLNKRLAELHTEEVKSRKNIYLRWAGRFNRSDYGKDWEQKLTGADLSITGFNYVLIQCVLLFVITYLLNVLLGMRFPMDMIVAYFVVTIGSSQWLKSRRRKFAAQIDRQLPEVCRMLGSSIRAGMSIQQAIGMVAEELKAPAGPLFQNMARELKLGNTMDTVLSDMTDKFSSRDIRLLTQTITIQRQAGGNLAKAMDQLAKTLEERERMNKELSNQTAESRYIALTLALMPVFLVVAFNIVFKGFITPLFTIPGLILLVVVVILMLIGFMAIRKVTNIKA